MLLLLKQWKRIMSHGYIIFRTISSTHYALHVGTKFLTFSRSNEKAKVFQFCVNDFNVVGCHEFHNWNIICSPRIHSVILSRELFILISLSIVGIVSTSLEVFQKPFSIAAMKKTQKSWERKRWTSSEV